MTTNTDKAVTLADVMNLAAVIETAVHGDKVARVMSDGNVVYGHARSVGDERGASVPGADVRSLYLRVTTKIGLEAFWPVAELATQVPDGEFAAYDW